MGCGIQHWRQLHTYTHEELVRVQIAYDDELEVESSESLFATEISRSGSPTDDLNWPKWWQLLAFVHLSWCPITFWKLNLLDSIFLFLLLQECACQGWIQSIDKTTSHRDWLTSYTQPALLYSGHSSQNLLRMPQFLVICKTRMANHLPYELVTSCRDLVDRNPQQRKIANKMATGDEDSVLGCSILGFKRSLAFRCVPFQCSPNVPMF